jgi:hypothetical protein
LPNEGNKPLSKKPKKAMIFSQVQKYLSYAIFVGKNVQSDHKKINCVKYIVCWIVKGTNVILGSKLFVFKKDARKTKVVWDMPHLGKKKREFYVNKKCNQPKLK